MKRLLMVLAVLALSAPAVWADVTVTMSITGSAAQTAINGTQTGAVKGTKFRMDTALSGQNYWLLLDSATKQVWRVDDVARQIQLFDPQAAMASLPVSLGDATASVTPNGQTREILGRQCQGYNVQVTIPMTMAGETITIKMWGPAWITKDGGPVQEYLAAQKVFSELGLSSPLMGQGPQSKGVAELSKKLGEAGLVMEQEVQMTMEGTGQMAAMLSQMGSMTMLMKVTAISTDPIPDSKFVLPEGYTKK